MSKYKQNDGADDPQPRKRRKVDSSASKSSATLPKVDAFYESAAKWNLEQDYETKSRKNHKKKNESTRLPIKTADGRVEQLQVAEVVVEKLHVSKNEKESKASDIKSVKPEIPVPQQILEAKEELARVAGLINEDPEEHIGALKTMALLAQSEILTIKKLTLATQLTVFKDVIPGYRVRPLAEADMTEKVSKEVRKLRHFEQSLVASYQNYLKDLAQHAKQSAGKADTAFASLGSVAISCACALLLAVPHFNFRGDLLKILVDKLSGSRVDADFGKCRETFEALFQHDEDGTASLDAVKMLTRMMKARSYSINEGVLNTFLHLRLLSEFSSKGSQNSIDKPTYDDTISGKRPKFKKEFRTKKARKELKEQKVMEKEFQAADAVVGHEERDRMQAETLKLVFVTYFRILQVRSKPLMGAVLEGLAKYAHLINQDFFGDLLEVLKDLIIRSFSPPTDSKDDDDDADSIMTDPAAMRSSLLCAVTAFALLEGQDAAKAANTLHLDLSFFTAYLYRSLHALATHPDIELSAKTLRLADPHASSSSSTTNPHSPLPLSTRVNVQTTAALLLRCLSATLSPRNVPPLRLAAFTHRLTATALHLPERSSRAVLALLAQLARSQGRKIVALWNTEERRGDGAFVPEAESVEAANPFAATVWAGEILRLHYAPRVREGLKEVEGLIAGVAKRG